jgi:hypothetical protein
MNRISARLSPDGQTVAISEGDWSQIIQADQLPQQLRFYRALAARTNERTNEPGAFAQFYLPMIKALEAVQRAVEFKAKTEPRRDQ